MIIVAINIWYMNFLSSIRHPKSMKLFVDCPVY